MPNLYLQANSTPPSTEFPGTVDDMLIQIAQYLSVMGIGDFNGINFGSSTPSVSDRDKPWLETDGTTGEPLKWRVWDGSAWTPLVYPTASGTSSQKPVNPEQGQLFWDSTLKTLLVWDNTEWITAAGSPGDLKWTHALDETTLLLYNPGWERVQKAYGRVPIVAGFGSGLTNRDPEDVGGLETAPDHAHGMPSTTGGHTLTVAEIPSHTHTVTHPNQNTSGGGGPIHPCFSAGTGGPISVTSESAGGGSSHTHTLSGSTNSGGGHDNMSPFIAFYLIRKKIQGFSGFGTLS